MMKKLITALFVLLMAACMYGCGNKQTAIQTQDSQNSSDDEMTSMVNPMVEYSTFPELEKQIDFEYLIIPESNGFQCENIYLISKETVDIDYVSKENAEVEACVRTAKGNEDISGYYGMSYQEEKIGDITVQKGEFKGETKDEYARVAWWTNGSFTYAVSFKRLEAEAVFDSLLESAVELSATLNQ